MLTGTRYSEFSTSPQYFACGCAACCAADQSGGGFSAIQVSGGSGGETANGSLTALRPATGNPLVDGVLSGVQWPTTTITTFFPSSVVAYNNYIVNGVYDPSQPATFSPVTQQQANALNWGMALIEDYTNIDFIAGSFDTANIRFANYQGRSIGFYPDGFTTSGDIFMGTDNNAVFGNINFPNAGDFNFATHLHELGHALGLSHGHENGITNGGQATDRNGNSIPNTGVLPSQFDNWNWSLMTYRSYEGASTTVQGGRFSDNPITFMPADILALQTMYGANYTGITSTDSVWRWDTQGFFSINGNPNIQAANGKMLMTVWDGGGNDTYDFSAHSSDQSIDLRPGEFSTFNTAQLADLDAITPGLQAAKGNVANAFLVNGNVQSYIENAIAGSGNDTIIGNPINNVLRGNNGNDSIDGQVGADTMIGGFGDDGYVVENSGDVVTEFAGQGNDTVYTSTTYNVPLNVEVLIMTGTADINTTGTGVRDIIIGNSGANIINGATGIDVMQGGGGNDTYAVDNPSDAVIEVAGGGFDNVYSSVDYVIDGSQEIESAILTGNATVLRGDNSNNQLFGNAQVNVIDGRGGTDYMLGQGGADIFQINLEPGAVDIVGDFSKAQGDRMAFTGFNPSTTFVNQASATSFEVRDTRGTQTLADDTVQTFQLNDSYGSGVYTQGALVFGVDYYFG